MTQDMKKNTILHTIAKQLVRNGHSHDSKGTVPSVLKDNEQ